MKTHFKNPAVFYTALFITAVFTLGISIGLNYLWFGLYELVKNYFGWSFERATIGIATEVWALAMIRAIPIITKE